VTAVTDGHGHIPVKFLQESTQLTHYRHDPSGPMDTGCDLCWAIECVKRLDDLGPAAEDLKTLADLFRAVIA
jgi:hypothetical protein